jgi:site-specific recombinase XerD
VDLLYLEEIDYITKGLFMEIGKAITYFISSLHYEEVSQHTIRAYSQDLNQWLQSISQEEKEHLELEALTFDDFQNYFMQLKKLSLKSTSIRRKRVVLHRFLKFCYDKKMCMELLHTHIDSVKMKKNHKPKEVLQDHEIREMFAYLEEEQRMYKSKQDSPYYQYLYYCSIRNELIITLLLYTGCRANELVTLEKDAIHLEKNTLVILAKGSKYNEVPLHDKVREALFKYNEKSCQWKETDLGVHLEKSPYLFPSKLNHQDHLDTRSLHDLMKKLSKVIHRAIHAHLFRHTFASYCIAANVDIATLSSMISHSNPAITLSVYTHEIQSAQKQEEIKKLKF